MTRGIGWVLLVGGFVWFGLMGFTPVEPTLLQVIGTASMMVSGAILAK